MSVKTLSLCLFGALLGLAAHTALSQAAEDAAEARRAAWEASPAHDQLIGCLFRSTANAVSPGPGEPLCTAATYDRLYAQRARITRVTFPDLLARL